MTQSSPQNNDRDSLSGFVLATITYLIWGFLPLFMKEVAHISPIEVVAHRVIWALPVALAVLIWLGRTADLKAALQNRKMLGMAAITASIVSLNWGIYVYAIGAGKALDAALGYYINPLFSVFLSTILLRERLAPLQWAALALAAVGVAIITFNAGKLPLLALSMTLTWGFYAYFKRSLPIGPNQGFALEVILLLPFALMAYLYFALTGQSHFLTGSGYDTLLLLGCGLATAVPLILYANSAKRLRLSTIAMMQYISPTLIFICAVFIFKEPFNQTTLLAFGFIWAGLVVFTLPALKRK